MEVWWVVLEYVGRNFFFFFFEKKKWCICQVVVPHLVWLFSSLIWSWAILIDSFIWSSNPIPCVPLGLDWDNIVGTTHSLNRHYSNCLILAKHYVKRYEDFYIPWWWTFDFLVLTKMAKYYCFWKYFTIYYYFWNM